MDKVKLKWPRLLGSGVESILPCYIIQLTNSEYVVTYTNPNLKQIDYGSFIDVEDAFTFMTVSLNKAHIIKCEPGYLHMAEGPSSSQYDSRYNRIITQVRKMAKIIFLGQDNFDFELVPTNIKCELINHGNKVQMYNSILYMDANIKSQ
jgi:hypothetical protein